jgi:restriction system protein
MPGMKLKMHQNSIFAILLRSPWWVSAALAAAMFFLARLLIPAEYSIYAVFLALPFFVISAHTLWKQLRAPSEDKVAARLEALRAMSWQEFSVALEDAFRRDGYSVKRIDRSGADIEIVKAGRVTLVAGKRWKVGRTGIEALRELDAARVAHDAHDSIYIASGEVTDTARAFASKAGLRLVEGADLTRLVPVKLARASESGKPAAPR